tara:strand:+ start:12071 stop:12736 length:666 start_codon:yes stop_codon:yes gene_type:complete
MPTITSHTDDGYIYKIYSGSWSTARDAASGTYQGGLSGSSLSVQASVATARGGGTSYRIYRSFFKFDTSGVTSTVASATLKITGNSTTTADVIALKCPHDFGFANADFDNITGWTTGSSNGSGGGDNESNVTKYSDEIIFWHTSINSITLTSAALADMVSQDTFVVALIEFDHDLKDITPTGSNAAGVRFAEIGTAIYRPTLDYTLAPTVSDNAVFFGTNF